MAVSAGNKMAWGRASKGFAQVLLNAGKTVTKMAAEKLGVACENAIDEIDWDWPRGARYDATHNGRNVRGATTYAHGYRGGDAMHPWYSGNLHDSIAVGVMQGGRILFERQMRPGATEDADYKGQMIDGYSAGRDALARAAHTFGPGVGGLRAVIVIGASYADMINSATMIGPKNTVPNTHIGYADYISEYFFDRVWRAMLKISDNQIIAK